MAKVGVLRLIEYVYESYEAAQRDIDRWAVPANGTRQFNSQAVLRSTIIVRPDPNIDYPPGNE